MFTRDRLGWLMGLEPTLPGHPDTTSMHLSLWSATYAPPALRGLFPELYPDDSSSRPTGGQA